MIDNTDAKLTEQAMRQSEQKVASVFHHCPDMLVLANCADGRFLAVNSPDAQQLRIPPDDARRNTPTAPRRPPPPPP
ncbi:hypothetical protein ACNQPN_29365, partial [Pseudomonas aeruginosa]|uniref:hypothetical protein n=1 Tax=Pseudomonas aeruginosa TaxID=287 RepID=UPI003F80034D